MSGLDQVLSVDRTFLEDFGASKKKVLQTIAERLSSTLSGVSELELFDQLIAREKLGSTGIGSGVAVPHCRLSGIKEPVAALVKLPTHIDFDAIDQAPVNLLFALIVPMDATDEHLNLLAAVVERVSRPDSLELIHHCRTATELYDLFVNPKP